MLTLDSLLTQRGATVLTVLAQSVAEKQRKMVEGCRPGIKWSQGAQQAPNLFKSPSFTCLQICINKTKEVIYTLILP